MYYTNTSSLKNSKRSLFISYDGLTDPLGQSQILPYYKGLSSRGYQITILSCEKPEAFKKKEKFIRQICKENNIRWEYVFYSKNPPVFSTFLDLKKMEKKALKIHREQAFDIVHCRTILPTSIGLKLQKLGVKFIFDIRGFWADERVDGKLWNLKNPLYLFIYKWFKKKEKRAYNEADKVVTLTQNAKQELVKRFQLNDKKIAVVPCTVDLEHFKLTEQLKIASSKLKSELGLNDHSPIVCYSGSLGTRYMVKEMLLCFKKIVEQHTSAIFLIVTHSNTSELKSVAQELGLVKNIKITSTDYQSIPQYVAIADVALYFILAGNSGKAVSPTKQAEFLSLGVPIITNSGIGDSAEIITENKLGIIVNEFTEASYERVSEQISTLLAQPNTEIVNIAEEYFSLEKGIETYFNVYQELC